MSEVFKSRFGYHPCSKETDKKLRFLNGIYQKALSSAAAWNRWERKAPHNRVQRRKIFDEQGRCCGRQVVLDALGQPLMQPEPKICPLFCNKVSKKCLMRVLVDGRWHTKLIEREFIEINDLGVPAAARQSRTPLESELLVKPLSLTVQQIDHLVASTKA